jgi:ligand-binding sensor domain-containing protein
MRNWLLISWVLLRHLLAEGQTVPFSFRNMSINEGLSQSSVVDIATDDAGFLWFATQDGLNRYDGRELVIFKKNFDDITTTTFSKLGKVVHHLQQAGQGSKRIEQHPLADHQRRQAGEIQPL